MLKKSLNRPHYILLVLPHIVRLFSSAFSSINAVCPDADSQTKQQQQKKQNWGI